MTDARQHLVHAIRATLFLSPTVYSWFGVRSPRLPASLETILPPRIRRAVALLTLRAQLYADYYCRGFAAPPRTEAPARGSLAAVTPFVAELARANAGRGYWEHGWIVRSIEAGHVTVSKRGLRVWTPPAGCEAPGRGRFAPGTHVRLRFDKGSSAISPGFYMAFSDENMDRRHAAQLVRVYWNVTPAGAIRLMRLVTRALNRTGLPFRLKVLSDPNRFTRCDAAVLYMRRRDYDPVREIIERIYAAVASSLHAESPAFTKMLAPGLGLAEDPGDGMSFGLHRCGLVADGLMRAHEHGRTSLEDRLREVERRFAAEGLRLDAAFLNRGSADLYEFRPAACWRDRPNRHVATSPDCAAGDNFLAAAEGIGRRLCREAVWHGGRCSWLGFAADSAEAPPARPGISYGALGSDLYTGTAGIGLFLALLYASAGEPAVRRTALGALRHAASGIDEVAARDGRGLYTGWTGIAMAAAFSGVILRDDECTDLAVRAIRYLRRVSPGRREIDILSGDAGAIVAMLALRVIIDDDTLVDAAAQLGDEIIGAVRRIRTRPHAVASRANRWQLTGLSHGAAGVGYALLELSHVTGEAAYRSAAASAFTYERRWFDRDAWNWPDFRGQPTRTRRQAGPRVFSTTWCHGAPGIALSRLRAYELTKDATYRDEALIGLRTTDLATQRWLRAGEQNFSLCHGLAGNADVLYEGARVLGLDGAGGADRAVDIARTGIAASAARGYRWPCGTGSGETPGLMLGLAGIGYFFLRLHSPGIPSCLLVRPEQWNRRDTRRRLR